MIGNCCYVCVPAHQQQSKAVRATDFDLSELLQIPAD